MKNTEHAQLYRELAISADHYAAQLQGQAYSRNWAQQTRNLAARARKAAEEIEGWGDHDFSVGDLIDQEWDRQRCFTTDDGDQEPIPPTYSPQAES